MSNLDDMRQLSTQSVPIVLRAPKRVILYSIASSIVIMLLGFSEITTKPLASIFLLVLFGIAACACVFLLFNASMFCMVMDEDGIACLRFGKIRQSARWREVDAVHIEAGDWVYTPTPVARVVIIDYSHDGQSESICVRPRLYGLYADEFLALVSRYYKAAPQRQNSGTAIWKLADCDRSEHAVRIVIAFVALALAIAIYAIASSHGVKLHPCGRGLSCDDSSIAPNPDAPQ